MDKISFSLETLLKHVKDYFETSLRYFPQKYLYFFLKEDDQIPEHVAYLCPLCLSNILVVNLETKAFLVSSDFDLDHYPQKSIGGNKTILVCKSCNNEAGHNFEFALKKHLHLSSFSHNGLSHKVDIKSSIENIGAFNSKLWKDENGKWQISLKKDENIKMTPLDNWIEYIKVSTDWELQITIPKPKEDHINKAILKSAYLYCFSFWGYEFAFSKAGDLFRLVLSNKADYPMAVIPLSFDNKTTPNFDKIPTGLCYISKPENLKSLVANICVKDKTTGFEKIHPVFIPNPTESGFEDLKKIQILMDDKITGDITFTPLLNILKETPIAYSKTWDYFQNV